MQINLTGFLNARRAREFMGELWQLFVDAQQTPDGIPCALIEKKMEGKHVLIMYQLAMRNLKFYQELKATSASKEREQPFARAVETDWKHRYQSLTGGRYGLNQPSFSSHACKSINICRFHIIYICKFALVSEHADDDERERRRRDPDDDRDRYLERRVEREEKYFKERKELLREMKPKSSPRKFSESTEKRHSRRRERFLV
jgi:hypothetical protein